VNESDFKAVGVNNLTDQETCSTPQLPRRSDSQTNSRLSEYGSTKIVVYFHGNAEDLHTSYDFTLKMSLKFRCNVFVMEYPGYGLYT